MKINLSVANIKKRISDLTQKWLDGWNNGTGDFNAEDFRDLFAPGDNSIEVFDKVKGDVVVIRSVDEYIHTWGPFMALMMKWSVRLDDLKIKLSGDMALTTFKLVGTDTRGPDGNIIPFGQYGTHVWQRLPDFGWRIIHEHLTMFKVDPEAES